jgi:glucokinase
MSSLTSATESVIALDLGGTNLRIAAVTQQGEVLHLTREKTRADSGPDNLIKRMVAGIRRLEETLDGEGREVRGISIGAPGVIARERGVVMSSPNLPGWEKIPLLERLSSEFKQPMVLENDANAAAFGEFWSGAGNGRKTMVLLTLGTGVGGGIIVNGELLEGADGMAGEIGHLTVEREGAPCPCGNRGCLERYASATGIAARYGELAGSDGAGTSSEDVYRLAIGGDSYAQRALAEAGMYLGVAMAAIVNILNPECIIIGGGVLPAWAFIIPAAAQEMKSRAFQAPAERVEIIPAALGDRAGIIGAAGIIWEGGGT